jgi:hypothetical protein
MSAEMERTQLKRALIYQRIGEFAVSFQRLESQVREIGWLLVDPHRTEWPPTQLRKLANHDLLERVKALYVERVSRFPGVGGQDYCDSFQFVIERAHKARQTRNDLLHSAFVELEAGGEVHGIMRVNLKLVVDEDGERQVASELLTDAGLSSRLAALGQLSVAVNMHYTQLIHWSPFDRPPHLEGCGLQYHRTGLPFARGADDDPPAT